MLADLGFNTYRFSLEWARIEPEEGFFSNAELEHYRRMLATCREHNLTTLLTYSHFSMPRWFAYKGGWQNPAAPDLYARFCERATKHLGDLVGYASTFNEPDIPQLLNWINLPGPAGRSLTDMFQGGLAQSPQAAQRSGICQLLSRGREEGPRGSACGAPQRQSRDEIGKERHAGGLQPGDDGRPAGARGQSRGRKARRCLWPLA